MSVRTIVTVLLGPVKKRRFSVPVFDRIVVVRSLGQGWPQAIAEGDARRPGRGRARRQPDRGRGASAQPERGRKREAGIWQRRYREHTTRDDGDYAAHMDDVHFNPEKHGVAAHAAAWPFSSFRRCVARGTYPEHWTVADVDLAHTGERPHQPVG